MQNRHISPALPQLIFISTSVFSSCLYTSLEFLSCPTQEPVLRPLPLKVFPNDLIKKVKSEEAKSADNTTLFKRSPDKKSFVEGSCDTKELGYKTAN